MTQLLKCVCPKILTDLIIGVYVTNWLNCKKSVASLELYRFSASLGEVTYIGKASEHNPSKGKINQSSSCHLCTISYEQCRSMCHTSVLHVIVLGKTYIPWIIATMLKKYFFLILYNRTLFSYLSLLLIEDIYNFVGQLYDTKTLKMISVMMSLI